LNGSNQKLVLPGFRHIEKGMLSRYSEFITVKIYPNGERRIEMMPSKELLLRAFGELGTRAAVASAFGVARSTVKHWTQNHGIEVVSHPEAILASTIRHRLSAETDKCKVSQWLMDEGSVSVAYFAKSDHTILLVCGSMNDFEVLSSISEIVDTKITSSKAPGPKTLPIGAIRVQSARAYALLDAILPHLVGLKAKEAEAALKFFPPSGLRRGRHTTDEFLFVVWKEFSLNAIHEWNKMRKVKISEEEINERARIWVESRIRRARRFLDAPSVPSDNSS
jgi:hypothetical protein